MADPLPDDAGDAERQTVAGLISALLTFTRAAAPHRAALAPELQRFAVAVLEAERRRALSSPHD